MKTLPVYTTEQWEKVSALPVEFFRQYASLSTKNDRLTTIHMNRIINKKEKVEDPFSESSLFELFNGRFDGLILAYIMKNQELFIES